MSAREFCSYRKIFYNCLFCCFFLVYKFYYIYAICFLIPNHFLCLPLVNEHASGFRKTYAHTSFELTLTCLVLARLIFSRKKRCILWPFKLTSCGSSADNSANVQCVVVGSFAKSTQGHLLNVRYLKTLP